MRAGRLRHKVDVRRPVPGEPDGYGSTVTTEEVVYAGVPAEVRHAKSGEDERGRRIESHSEYEVTLRYLGDLKSTDVLLWEGRELHVDGVMHDPRKTKTTAMCGVRDA